MKIMEVQFKFKARLLFFINALFLFAFFVHVGYIGYGIKYPDTPSIKRYTKDFNELDEFPISFKLCVSELTNPHNRYQKFGYDSIWSFFKGRADDGVWVGWTGHNNSTKRSVRGRFCLTNVL